MSRSTANPARVLAFDVRSTAKTQIRPRVPVTARLHAALFVVAALVGTGVAARLPRATGLHGQVVEARVG